MTAETMCFLLEAEPMRGEFDFGLAHPNCSIFLNWCKRREFESRIMITSVVIIRGYTALYSLVHSWLASQRMKDWTRQTLGPTTDRWYRLAYNSLAGLTLLPLLALLALLPDRDLYTLPPPWLWLALLGQLIAVAGILYGLWQTNI